MPKLKPLIIANWKMNPQSLAEAKKLFNLVKKGIKNVKNIEAVICPPFPYLLEFLSMWTPPTHHPPSLWLGPKGQVLRLGAQNCFWEEKGAFTGEVSPKMLKDLGCQYVILGHSERRRYQKETDEMINKKIKAALRNNLKPILCVENVLQTKRGLEGISKEELKNVVLAYEPVFAIGTGKPCSPQKAVKMRVAIKSIINKDIPILYGGSVNSQNARDYIKETGFQGLLVGGASLDAKEFVEIVKNVSQG